ncbi:uncharacterized protein LOC143291730 isoform X2 [Babylonia areolata]|uniref:uncharacterized protein LOC143291730 isoform X2 n=1 Tax=Babylonia areolata TaxID=304850 RepID=UPI003FD393A5
MHGNRYNRSEYRPLWDATDYGTGQNRNEFSIVVVGKTGNGKSSLCNALIGQKVFAVGRGLSSTTVTAQCETVVKGNMRLKVVDTPDITNLTLDSQQMRAEVDRWRQLTQSTPSAVLLTVRCDIRYTAEEHAIYREIMALWPQLKERLVVAFTFGDRQDQPLEEELRAVCPELKSVLRDAGQAYLLYDNKNEQSRNQVFFDVVSAAERRKGGRGAAGAHDAERGRASAGGSSPVGTGGSGRISLSRKVLMILVVLLVIVAILFVIFLIVKQNAAAIAFGVIGVVLFCILAFILYVKYSR